MAIKKAYESGIGYRMNGTVFPIMAYADDIILLSESKEGLQDLLDIVLTELRHNGLEANADKCASIIAKKDGKQKKWVISSDSVLLERPNINP